jgi:hypothetical protein
MKFASVKSTPGINRGKFIFSGEQLLDRHSEAPTGFYTNNDTSYKGVVFRDKNGNCTYFDRTHGLVYAFEKDVWDETIFTWQPTMSTMSVKITA